LSNKSDDGPAMRELMVKIHIQNVGKQAVGASTGVPLPPPFHMIRLGPGEGNRSFCKVEDLHKQYPHRSGFEVAAILQQLVQLGRIQVDIRGSEDESQRTKLAEFMATQRLTDWDIERGIDIPTEKPALSVRAPEPPRAEAAPEISQELPELQLPDVDDSAMAEADWPERWPETEREPSVEDDNGYPAPERPESPGEDMSGQDDLPEMVETDPLYGTPPKDKGKKRVKAKKEPEAADSSESSGTAIDLPADAFVTPPQPKQREGHKDKFESAMKMSFIGAGQGGGRLAESFWKLGYRRICCINTTEQDLKSLEGPTKLVIGNNRGGAGKDPEQGRLAAKESYEDIMDLMMRSWGDDVEQMFICVGAGGGSGTGSWPVLVKAAREYGESTNVEKPISKHLGVIMTMPKRSEGSRVQYNALAALRQAVEMVESKKISTLIIVDNAKIHDLYPGLPVKKFWPTTNHNFAAMLHTFNLLASKDSEYNTFDRADFRSVIRNGTVIFGMTSVRDWEHKEDISQAVRQNLTGSLLADGFDLSKADMAGAIVVAHDDVLGEIPMENIDYAFNSLGRSLGNEGITLHSGIYEGNSPGMRVFTIVSGLEPPEARFEELERLST